MTSASVISIDGVASILLVIKDVSDAKSAEAEIRNLAFFDPLTKLANRNFLVEQLQKSSALSSRTHRMRALLLVDLDHFSRVNDTLGLRAGDMLLREVAARLGAVVLKSDTVGRLGSDEFVVLIEELNDSAEESATNAQRVGEEIAARINLPYLLDGHEWACTCSIGISIFGQEHEDVHEVLQQAEIALHKAKKAGRNSLHFFEPSLQEAVKARAVLEKSFRLGLKAKQFLPFYQPQFYGGRLIGAEALLRWKHPTKGILSAGEFIPLAEETRLILPLGVWMLETVCRQLAVWANRPHTSHIKIAVNISTVQLEEHDFVEQVLNIIEHTGADPRNLRLELVESILVTKMDEAINKMTKLRAHGVGFALDDFGTGYSSLSYLRSLPIDELKIDRSFVRDIIADATSKVIAQTIVSLGNAMGLPVIAEGVETIEQKKFLEGLGCDRFQGYLLSPPLPLDQFELLLQESEMSPTTAS
jgi:diguanylate cyclase (GGDEF)-like protein